MATEAQQSSTTDVFLPPLPLSEWQATYDTLHMWTQIVGKVRLRQCPQLNHWWGAALYVTANGLTTSPVPYQNSFFEMRFDFVSHRLVVECSSGQNRIIKL